MAERSFRSKPLNALNLQYEQFNNKILELAFKSPESFFWLRRNLMQSLLEDQVTTMYNMIFNLLTQGSTNNAGDTPFIDMTGAPASVATTLGDFAAGDGFRPKMSEQKADEMALDLVAGLQQLLREKIVDQLLPKTIFNSSLERSAKAAALQVGGGADDA